MFSVVALALLISLGIVLVVFFAAKLLYPRASFDSFHIVLAALVVLFSTVAAYFGLVNVKAKNALDDYVGKPASYVHELTEKIEFALPVLSIFNSRVSDLIYDLPDTVDSIVDSHVAPLQKKLNRAICIHFSILAVINILFFIFLLKTGRNAGLSRVGDGFSDDDLDGFSSYSGTGHSFDDDVDLI